MKSGIKILTIVLLFFSVRVLAQEVDSAAVATANSLLETADIIMEETIVLTQARDYYQSAADTDPTNVRANYMAGLTFLQTTEKYKGTKYLLRAYQQDSDYKFNILYLIGQGYHYAADFENAIDYYKQYRNKLENNSKYSGPDKTSLAEVERRIYECKNGVRYKKNALPYSILNVGTKINSDSWDYAPVVNADETIMVFTSRRSASEGNLNDNVFDDNFFYEDIFISKKRNGEWQQAENIGSVVNTKYHDSNLGFSPDGKTLYIYSDEGNGDIYFTNSLSEDTWSPPQSLSDNINSEGYNEKSVSQSADGNTLFFASNRPGGNGGFDIYYSQKNKKGEWGPSRNVGSVINTELDEDGPFIQFDGKTLYFSSTGHNGMGGFDIYKSEYDSASSEWGSPENLGYPLNSPDDDIYFVMTKDGKTGYYATVREDGMGYNDIYKVTIGDINKGITKSESKKSQVEVKESEKKDVENVAVEENETTVEEETIGAEVNLLVRVLDDATGEIIPANVKLKNPSDNINVPLQGSNNGIYSFVVIRESETDFLLSVDKPGYIFYNQRITIPASAAEPQTLRKTVRLEKPEVGTRKRLNNIFFETGKASFTIESYEELNKMVRFLEQNNVNVEIAGHTDDVGPADYNKQLSQRRANNVLKFLVDKGIDRRRLTAVGYGEERPIVSNDDEVMGREINRRVEFVVKE